MQPQRLMKVNQSTLARIGVAVICQNVASAIGQTDTTTGLGGGGEIERPGSSCISPEQRASVDRQIAANRKRLGLTSSHGDNPHAPYEFYPQAGNLWQEMPVANYVDLDPGGGILDFDCGPYTYNGHRGHDSLIRSFGEQDIGVPIFAAADGIVIATQDGQPDKNTSWSGQPANYVVIDHGGGREGLYWHMRNGSVAVSVGQPVNAGEQIGMTASSGNSTWPHLHFESRDNGVTYEPNAGACRAGASGWANQTWIPANIYGLDAGITHQNLNQHPGLPWAMPRGRQIAISDPWMYLWIQVGAQPASSNWQVHFRDPNGVIVWSSGLGNFGGNPAYSMAWWWWGYNVPQSFGTLGEWDMLLAINGIQVVEAPFELVATRDPGENTAPEPIGASFDPPNPGPDDVVFCRVDGSLLIDDLDYDIVQYRYDWKVNGQSVRNVVTAGRADALPKGTLQPGDTLECTVSVSDGQSFFGHPVTVTAGTACYADCDQSTGPGVLDLFDFLCFQSAFVTSDPYACDCDTSTGPLVCDLFDFLCFQGAFVAGCP